MRLKTFNGRTPSENNTTMTNKTNSISRLLFIVALTLAGCAGPEGRVKTALYDTTPRTPSTRLDVFQVGEKPTRPFHVLALMTAEGAAQDEAECVQGMVIRARNLGADGLVILEPEAPNKSIVFKYGWAGPSPDDRVFKGNGIIYDK